MRFGSKEDGSYKERKVTARPARVKQVGSAFPDAKRRVATREPGPGTPPENSLTPFFSLAIKPARRSPSGSNRMNKAELIDAVAEKSGLSKADASRAVDTVVDVISKALKKGEKVSLVGFGVFSVRKRAARKGRNPKTGEEIKIPAGKTPAFKAGKALKDSVN